MKDNLLLNSYVQVCHLNLKYAACIATKPLQKGNLDTTKLSKLCLRIGNQTRRFQKSLTKENDALAISVKRRIRFTTDLHAADAVYHTACNSSFRAGKKLPKKYSEKTRILNHQAQEDQSFQIVKTFFQQMSIYVQIMKNKLH